MTETKRVGGKGIYICGPHGQATCNQVEEGQSCDMQLGKVQDISLMYAYKSWQSRWIVIWTSCSKGDQDNIQARESTHQVKWYIPVNPCMWDEQNNHGKIRMTMLSRARWSINIISMSMYSTNMAMKHRKIKILNQDNRSHNQHVKYLIQIYQWGMKKLAIS